MYDIELEIPDPTRVASPGALWSHPVVMTEAARLQDLEPRLLVARKGQFRAAELPLYERRRLGSVTLQTASGSYYQGLRCWHQQESPAPRRLLDELQISSAIAVWLKDRYRRLLFNLSPENTDVRGFTWNLLKATPLYTFIQDLSLDIHPLRDEREKLRRADERGYSFECRLDVDAFLELSDAMFERKGHHAYTRADKMKDYITSLHQAGLLEQYNVCLDKRVVSANILLSGSDDLAYTVLRASHRDEMRNGVSLWHTSQLLQSLKGRYQKLDLCGANVPEVARFKAAMGLSLVAFYRISS
ncbi:MAG: GNAT family N-acetyltransferase [Candidatus Cloacimonetes bacterium]|nr:GNAT family N-acetyltransferase [Candidatus Cloacimonadota bacterium]HNZ07528.1 GNAT family N-acetyltransferase [Candidatus Cloacimonadota bacterium]HOH78200.1 GNAT family N-acetyltransferase [Candidatus Cloacimonadota bacterium]